jgi:formylglycine-generating enzyme required for sulfatase activity
MAFLSNLFGPPNEVKRLIKEIKICEFKSDDTLDPFLDQAEKVGAPAVKPLCEMLEDKSNSKRIRHIVAILLNRIGGPAQVALEELKKNHPTDLIIQSAWALIQMFPEHQNANKSFESLGLVEKVITEKARLKAEKRTRLKLEAKARKAVEEKARLEAEEKTRLELETKAKRDAEEKASRTAQVELVTPKLGIGSTRIREKDGMVEVYVPAGYFLMGSADSDPDAQDDEKPQHSVYLDAFWMDQTPVTEAMYARAVAAGACTAPVNKGSPIPNTYYFIPEIADYPVIHVNWEQAAAYCRWVGGSLPSEAQWEKAARGTDGRIYPWGNQVPDTTRANFEGFGTTKVGSFPGGASLYGALDMAGNVWEWVADWYSSRYYYSASKPVQNPTGPAKGVYRVVRGGSWYYVNGGFRAAGRCGINLPSWQDNSIGFRCSR